MGTVIFYHLTRSPVASALLQILPRALDQGWRVLLRAPQPLLNRLDDDLWGGAPSIFVPHGLSGGASDYDQPVLLGNVAADGFDVVAHIGPQDLDLVEAANLQRLWVFFDGHNEPELTAARNLWRKVAASTLTAQYFSEETGRWIKKASANESA